VDQPKHLPSQNKLGAPFLPPQGRIRELLSVYGYAATADYCEKVQIYVDLLLRWNQKVPLTTITWPVEVVRFHFGETLFGMRVAKIENGRLADLGSGAGLPGVPIAMANPGMKVTLVESNGKKAAFLGEVQRRLSLDNISVYHGRAEEISSRDRFEFVAARALGDYAKWLEWASERLAPGGRLTLWLSSGGMVGLRGVGGWRWLDPEKIPRTKDRFVLTGEKR
jgi:16S rRNA (guanine(527)-N(7))-methyltransferase RsmG